MIFDIIQTDAQLLTSSFEVIRKNQIIGSIFVKGTFSSREAIVEGKFYNDIFYLELDKNASLKLKMENRPYIVKLNNVECGTISDKTYKVNMFNKYEYTQLSSKEKMYDLFSIGMGNEGSKCPIYLTDKQVALIEKGNIVYDDLHRYKVYSLDEESGLIAVMMTIYLYVYGLFSPGEVVIKGVKKTYFKTSNKFLRSKYDPLFKNKING